MEEKRKSLLRELECPSCGAPVKYSEGDSVATCEYCGSKAMLDNHQTIHIVDEAKIKEVELQRDMLRLKQRNDVDRRSARKKYNFLKTIVIVGAVLGFFISRFSDATSFFSIICLAALFTGVFVLPKMNPDKDEIIDRLHSRGGHISRKSRGVAFCLCFFLGWLGIHRFYVGKIGTGIIYVFTMGACGIGWLIDLIMIASGKFEDKDGGLIFE